MSLKKLLGLDTFPLKEKEIIQKIQQAYNQNKREIEFFSRTKRVVIKLSQLQMPSGIYDFYQTLTVQQRS